MNQDKFILNVIDLLACCYGNMFAILKSSWEKKLLLNHLKTCKKNSKFQLMKHLIPGINL